MALTAAEQYVLEMINRARLDPAGEAARYGINLNAGLAAGTISTASKQVLAPNTLLETAATGHSQWMLAADVFSHTGSGGLSASQRASAAGYGWANIGENLSWRGSSGAINLDTTTTTHHQELFQSAGHRQVMLNDAYQEVGIAQERGLFKLNGRNYDSSMLTELFGRPATQSAFLTGVIYNDTDKNSFYSIGEGVGGASIRTPGNSAVSAAAGGYAIGLKLGEVTSVYGQIGTLTYGFNIGLTNTNVKVDIINQTLLQTSGNVALNVGLNNVTLLGNANLTAAGNANANVITGNVGANRMNGAGGNDFMRGMDGNDTLLGSLGNDTILGGTGADQIDGGGDADLLSGNAGADQFIFANNFGRDTVTDFSIAEGDRLVVDNLVWGNYMLTGQQMINQYADIVAGNVVFEFSANEVITLTGVSSTAGLASAILII